METKIKLILDSAAEFLKDNQAVLIAEFQDIINGNWGLTSQKGIENVLLLDIEIFVDNYRMSLYPMNNENCQLGHKNLLKDFKNPFIPQLYDLEIPDSEFIKVFKEWDKIYIQWVSDCWDKLDSMNFKTKLYIMFHDGGKSFDLISKKWVIDEIKFPEIEEEDDDDF